MKKFLCSVIVGIAIISLVAIFLTTPADATWNSATEHIVTVDVFDLNGNYCHSYGYSYYIADTTTSHFKYYHRGPTIPDTHPYPHTATITGRYQHLEEDHLSTRCDGTYPGENVADSG